MRTVARLGSGCRFLQWVLTLCGLLAVTVLQEVHAATRLGPVTQEELNCWKQRAGLAPAGSLTPSCSPMYKTAGDVSANSPGDWNRIVSNANNFRSNPTAERWTAWNSLSGCVTDPPNPGSSRHIKLKDAAFVWFMTRDTSYLNPVRDELLFHAAQPGLDFTNASLWCANGRYTESQGVFEAAHWLSKLAVAYSFIRDDISTGDRATLNAWFIGMMNHFRARVDSSFVVTWPYYVDRLNGNWTLTSFGNTEFNRKNTYEQGITHYGGYQISAAQQVYNNRKGIIVSLFGHLGALFNDAQAIRSFKAYVKEALQFATFPDGTYYEFNRWLPTVPNLGLRYTANHWMDLAVVIDQLARIGDTELLIYTTSNGSGGGGGTSSTIGGPKSFKGIVDHLMRYVDNSIVRYGTDDPAKNGDPLYRIKINDALSGEHAVYDTYFATSNLYWKDPLIADRYRRLTSGAPPYPATPAGGAEYWGGTRGILPGILFMFGQMEGKVWPYSASVPNLPSVSLSADPVSIIAGQSSTLSWSSTNATSCAASGSPSDPSWSGSKSLSGSQSVSPAQTTVYTLTCSNSDGSMSKDAQVTVASAPTGSLANSSTLVAHSNNFSSNPDGANSPDKLWDGDTVTEPGSAGNANIASFWVEFDLGKPYNLTTFRLFGDAIGNWICSTWTLDYKQDPLGSYTAAFSNVPCNANQWFEQVLTQTARYVKVTISSTTGSTQARELELYGAPVSLRGDLDDNGAVDLADVRALIQMIVGQTPPDLTSADLDSDGQLSLGDVRDLINILISL